MTKKPIQIYFLFHQKDYEVLEELETHLDVRRLLKEGVRIRSNQDIDPGNPINESIFADLVNSDIILIGLSKYLFTSPLYERFSSIIFNYAFINDKYVIPIYLNDFNNALTREIKNMDIQTLPKERQRITDYPDQEKAFVEIANSILDLVKDIGAGKSIKLSIQNQVLTITEQIKKQKTELETLKTSTIKLEKRLKEQLAECESIQQSYKEKIDSITLLHNELSLQFKDLLPIGTIIPWYNKGLKNCFLPKGWERCNGQEVTDKDSPFFGLHLPNLNGNQLFLRGSNEAGEIQEQSWKSINIKSSRNIYQHNEMNIPKNNEWSKNMFGGHWRSDPDPHNGKLFGNVLQFQFDGSEIRPRNVGVIFVIKVL